MLIRNRILLLVLTLHIFAIGGGLSALTVIHDLQLAIEASQKSRQDLISIGKIRDLLLITTGEIDHLQNWKIWGGMLTHHRMPRQFDNPMDIHILVSPSELDYLLTHASAGAQYHDLHRVFHFILHNQI